MHDALIQSLNEAHDADPKGKERAYCASVYKWICKLITEPSQAVSIAAHAQHFERWVITRDSYPKDKPGYLRWRKDVASRQGERVAEIMRGQNYDQALTERVALLVAKKVPRTDPESQALEDAACLVFLEEQAADFAPKYMDKMIGILQKTWKKMSPQGHEFALQLDLPEDVLALVKEALS